MIRTLDFELLKQSDFHSDRVTNRNESLPSSPARQLAVEASRKSLYGRYEQILLSNDLPAAARAQVAEILCLIGQANPMVEGASAVARQLAADSARLDALDLSPRTAVA